MSLLPAIMKKIQLKMKALVCSQDFSHYKSMGIFPDAQGQLTLQSMVGSGQISYSSKTLWLSSLPAKRKKNQSYMKALECSQLKKIFFIFSYCMTMGDDDPRGMANLDPRGMIGRIYVEYNLRLLHTKYTSFRPCGFREKDF